MKSVELGISQWRNREFMYRLAVRSKKFLELNPYVGLSKAILPEDILEIVHDNIKISGEINVEQAMSEAEANSHK